MTKVRDLPILKALTRDGQPLADIGANITIDAVVARQNTRQCGPCYTCCVALGINTLHKWNWQTCKHLSGVNIEKRCGIYEQRPTACQKYQCLWRQGFLSNDTARPYESGVLATGYPGAQTDRMKVTLMVDREYDPDILRQIVFELLRHDIRVCVTDRQGNVVDFRDGAIYRGKLRRQTGYEDLDYFTYEDPIAHYAAMDLKNEDQPQ